MVISAIMSFDPAPISTLQPMTPPALDRVVKKCLAKEPEKKGGRRPATLSGMKMEVDWPRGRLAGHVGPTTTAKRTSALSRQSLFFGLCALLLGVALAGLAVGSQTHARQAPCRAR